MAEITVTKNELNIIERLTDVVESIDWGSSKAIQLAREAARVEAIELSSELIRIAGEKNIPLNRYIRNLIAESLAEKIAIWTAFLNYMVSLNKIEYQSLAVAAVFLASKEQNRGFLFQLIDGDELPSFETAIVHFQSDPSMGFYIGMKILAESQEPFSEAFVKGIKFIHKFKPSLID